jgi:hypothetical protein
MIITGIESMVLLPPFVNHDKLIVQCNNTVEINVLCGTLLEFQNMMYQDWSSTSLNGWIELLIQRYLP